jgi:hypothetical protein
VAHSCNPSYLEGKDQRDGGSEPAYAKGSRAPILGKNPSQKRAGALAQGVGPEYSKDKNKNEKV